MTPRDRKLLRDILENAGVAARGVLGLSAANVAADPSLLYKSLYALLIVGEAAGKLSAEAKASMPHVPWEEIVATRHFVAHGYDKVEPRTIISIAEDDLPPLIDAINAALQADADPEA